MWVIYQVHRYTQFGMASVAPCTIVRAAPNAVNIAGTKYATQASDLGNTDPILSSQITPRAMSATLISMNIARRK